MPLDLVERDEMASGVSHFYWLLFLSCFDPPLLRGDTSHMHQQARIQHDIHNVSTERENHKHGISKKGDPKRKERYLKSMSGLCKGSLCFFCLSLCDFSISGP